MFVLFSRQTDRNEQNEKNEQENIASVRCTTGNLKDKMSHDTWRKLQRVRQVPVHRRWAKYALKTEEPSWGFQFYQFRSPIIPWGKKRAEKKISAYLSKKSSRSVLFLATYLAKIIGEHYFDLGNIFNSSMWHFPN